MKSTRPLAFAALIWSIFCAAPAMAKDTFISIGGNPIGATAYQWAAGLAELLNQKVKGINVTAEGTKGYAANVRLLLNGNIEAGFANSKQAREVYLAEGEYAGVKPHQVVGWLSVAPIVEHVVVLENSGIKTLDDLKGKRVGIGQPGGTAMLDAENFMAAAHLKPGTDFKDFRVGLSEMADMLADGQLDAVVWTGSMPLPAVIKLLSQNKVRFIPIPPDVAEALHKSHPAYTKGVIPANTYAGQTQAIPSFQLSNVLLIRADQPEEQVYEMTKAIMENLKYMGGVHPVWKKVSKDTILDGFSTPIHPGALRYYREIGVPGAEALAAAAGK